MRPGLAAALLPFAATTAYVLTTQDKARAPAARANPARLGADDDLLDTQRPIFDLPGPAMPPSDQPSSSHGPTAGGDPPAGGPGGPGGPVMLSDVMGRDRSINVFAGLVRDVEGVSRRLDDAGRNSTVLAPLNSAMDRLPRKPWEDPAEYNRLGADAYEGDEGWERAQRNIRRFVEAHIVPVNPWKEGERVRTLDGTGEVWWESQDGEKVIQPGNIKVDSIASSVQNGQVWILKSVRNYSS